MTNPYPPPGSNDPWSTPPAPTSDGGSPQYDPQQAAQPAYAPQPVGPYAAYGYPVAAAPQTNSLAIAALVLALVGVASCITAPVGAILGHISLKQIRERGESGEGMAKAAIIVGWILTALLLVVIAVYVVIIVLAVANGAGTTSDY